MKASNPCLSSAASTRYSASSPLDDLLDHIIGGHFQEALKGFECLVEPVREKTPEAASYLEKIISGELSLAQALPRLLECLSHAHPETAKEMRMKIPKIRMYG